MVGPKDKLEENNKCTVRWTFIKHMETRTSNGMRQDHIKYMCYKKIISQITVNRKTTSGKDINTETKAGTWKQWKINWRSVDMT